MHICQLHGRDLSDLYRPNCFSWFSQLIFDQDITKIIWHKRNTRPFLADNWIQWIIMNSDLPDCANYNWFCKQSYQRPNCLLIAHVVITVDWSAKWHWNLSNETHIISLLRSGTWLFFSFSPKKRRYKNKKNEYKVYSMLGTLKCVKNLIGLKFIKRQELAKESFCRMRIRPLRLMWRLKCEHILHNNKSTIAKKITNDKNKRNWN